MPEEETRRKRRRRGGRRGRRSGRVKEEAAADEPQRAAGAPPVAWQWLTFPVFFAFACGGLLVLLIGPRPNTALYSVLFFVFLSATAFGLAHIATRLFIARRRR